MAKININFNGSAYQIDESLLADATTALQSHFSTTMSGSGSTIELGGVSYSIDSAKLASAKNDFVSHLGTISGEGEKIVINGVEYGIDSSKVSSVFDEFVGALEELVENSPGLTYMQTIQDGDYIYVYLGIATLEEMRTALIPQLEAQTGMTWDEIVAQVGGGDEEAVWTLLAGNGIVPSAEEFVPVEPQWGVAPVNTEITGANEVLSELEGAPVTTINAKAFNDCTNLLSINIPNSIITVGERAFYNCTSLTNVTIGNSVTSIGERAFEYCSSLTSISFGEDSQLESIGNSAFYNCTGLTSITIPDSVTSIGNSAFGYCSSLTSISFGEDSQLESIGTGTFGYCSSLTSVNIPNGVIGSGNRLCYKCTNLKSVTIPSGITNVFQMCSDCSSLVDITFTGTVSQARSIFYSLNSTQWNLNVPATYIQCSDGQLAI